MSTGEKKIWFPAKRYGWGWGPPVCWQGWVFLLLWIAASSGSAYFAIVRLEKFWLFFIFEAILIGVLILVCLLKGEKPGWHWGDKK